LSPTLNVFRNVGDNSIAYIVCANDDENLSGNSRRILILIPYRRARGPPALFKQASFFKKTALKKERDGFQKNAVEKGKKQLPKKQCLKKRKKGAIAKAIAPRKHSICMTNALAGETPVPVCRLRAESLAATAAERRWKWLIKI